MIKQLMVGSTGSGGPADMRLTISPANHRPANFWKYSLYVETVKSDAISGWSGEHQLQIWSFHYLSTNDYLHYLLEVRMRATSAWGQE